MRGGVFGVSGRGVDVFGLGHAGKLIFIARKTTEEDPAAQHQDGRPPAEAVCPGVVVITFIDLLVELDRVDDQSDYLDDYWNETKQSHFIAQRMCTAQFATILVQNNKKKRSVTVTLTLSSYI